jgi:hypothetical protein
MKHGTGFAALTGNGIEQNSSRPAASSSARARGARTVRDLFALKAMRVLAQRLRVTNKTCGCPLALRRKRKNISGEYIGRCDSIFCKPSGAPP